MVIYVCCNAHCCLGLIKYITRLKTCFARFSIIATVWTIKKSYTFIKNKVIVKGQEFPSKVKLEILDDYVLV